MFFKTRKIAKYVADIFSYKIEQASLKKDEEGAVLYNLQPLNFGIGDYLIDKSAQQP